MAENQPGNPPADTVTPEEGDAPGGDKAVTESKEYTELKKSFNDLQAKSRKQEKDFKELSSKLDTLLSRIPSDDPDDEDDDDDEPGDPGAGEGGGSPTTKPAGKNADPQVNKLLKKLKNERTRSEDQLKQERGKTDFWKSKFLKAEKGKFLREELAKAKPGVREEALPHLLRLLEPEIEEQVDDDGKVEFVHQSYPNVTAFITEFLNDNPLYVRNERAAGTGDGGGADRGANGLTGEFKLPANFANWSPEKQREYNSKLTPEQRKQVAKQVKF